MRREGARRRHPGHAPCYRAFQSSSGELEGEESMIDHTGLSVTDPAKSRSFYEAALAPLGYRVLMEVPVEHTGGIVVLGFGVPPKPDFWVHEGPAQTPRVHIAFRADDRAVVDAFHHAAIAAGGKDNGA